MDHIKNMTIFVRVVEDGSFSSAARRLNLSPSVVSMHIQALEKRLSVRLVNRTTRKISLTEIGKAYYERCRQILIEVEEADTIATALDSTPRGTLRLNTSPAVAVLLAPWIAKFSAQYPEVSFDLVTTDRMVALVEEGFDLAIRMIPVQSSSLIMRRLGSCQSVLCGAPDYLVAYGTPRHPADLVQHRCLLYAHHPFGDEWCFTGPDGIEHKVHVSGNLRTNSGEGLRLAAMHGQGLFLAPYPLVVDQLKSGELVPVLSNFSSFEFLINGYYPHRHYLSAKVRRFLDFVHLQLENAKAGGS